MIQNADHVTFTMEDPDAAIAFFAVLGLRNGHDTVSTAASRPRSWVIRT